MYRKPYFKLGLILLLLLVFLIPRNAHALDPTDAVMKTVLLQIYGILYIGLQGIISAMAFLTKTLDTVINLQLNADLPVLAAGWTLIRNFTNMFFIVIMIIIAFATIFDAFDLDILGVRGGDMRGILVKLVMTAVLINFSLVIGGLVIDATQTINGVFLNAINDFGNQLGQLLNPCVLVGCPEQVANAGSTSNFWIASFLSNPSITLADALARGLIKLDSIDTLVVIRLFSSVVLAGMIAFSLLVAVIFSIIRIPIIWTLLVISPLAWLAGILPSTRKLNGKWWHHFIAWNIYLPLFLFVLYFGLFFLNQVNTLTINLAQGTQALNTPLPGSGFTFQFLLLYIMAAMVLIGGATIALSGSYFGGAGVLKAAGWARGAVGGTLGRIPGVSHTKALGTALQEKGKEVKRYGIGPFGGQAAQEEREAKMKALLNVRGTSLDRRLAKETMAEKKRFKDENMSVTELQRELTGKNDASAIASAELLLEAGKLTAQQATNIKNKLKAGSIPQQTFINAVMKKLDDQAKEGQLRDPKELA
ncbi:MAG: hypothetical protein KW806_02215, partial [Candidatus Yanofskybacteria bacterium]|nr:hypothetical protein [Candidatus Yanofskybacteria bacterium]